MNGDSTGNPQEPLFSLSLSNRRISHYYGDYVRQLFVAAAAVTFIAIPLFGDLLPYGTFFQVACAIVAVLLGGLTNPHGKIVLWVDALFSGLGVLYLEATAITFYPTQSTELFLAREAAAILLLFAFYFSVKTVRSMSQGKVGHFFEAGEFDDNEPSA